MKIKDLIKLIAHYISVPKCVSCNDILSITETALCDTCMKKYNEIKDRNCALCSNQLYKCVCSNKHLTSHYVKRLIKVYRYLPDPMLPTNRIIYSLKRDDRKDVLQFAKNELREAIKVSIENPSEYIFTNVPRRKRSISKYGIDHSAELAKALAKDFSTEYRSLLVSKSKKAQKTMTGSDRINNAKFKYKRKNINLKGKRIILIDDIVTTGASMGTCATLIRGLGAKEIVGVTIAIAYKDPFVHFEYGDRFS